MQTRRAFSESLVSLITSVAFENVICFQISQLALLSKTLSIRKNICFQGKYYCYSFQRNVSQRSADVIIQMKGKIARGLLIFAKPDYDNGDLERNGSRATGATEGKSLEIIG